MRVDFVVGSRGGELPSLLTVVLGAASIVPAAAIATRLLLCAPFPPIGRSSWVVGPVRGHEPVLLFRRGTTAMLSKHPAQGPSTLRQLAVLAMARAAPLGLPLEAVSPLHLHLDLPPTGHLVGGHEGLGERVLPLPGAAGQLLVDADQLLI